MPRSVRVLRENVVWKDYLHTDNWRIATGVQRALAERRGGDAVSGHVLSERVRRLLPCQRLLHELPDRFVGLARRPSSPGLVGRAGTDDRAVHRSAHKTSEQVEPTCRQFLGSWSCRILRELVTNVLDERGPLVTQRLDVLGCKGPQASDLLVHQLLIFRVPVAVALHVNHLDDSAIQGRSRPPLFAQRGFGLTDRANRLVEKLPLLFQRLPLCV